MDDTRGTPPLHQTPRLVVNFVILEAYPMAPTSAQPSPFWRKLRLTLEMIKFEHSVFALPFALTAALLAVRDASTPAREIAWKLAWIVVAMVAARSAAMTFNRIVDSQIDARNPRTRMRQLPTGTLSARFARGFFAAACVVFLVARWASSLLATASEVERE